MTDDKHFAQGKVRLFFNFRTCNNGPDIALQKKVRNITMLQLPFEICTLRIESNGFFSDLYIVMAFFSRIIRQRDLVYIISLFLTIKKCTKKSRAIGMSSKKKIKTNHKYDLMFIKI